MISCRVSRREYKAQQGKLSVHLPAVRPLLRLHFQVVFSWPRSEWARGRRGARSEWHLRGFARRAARPAAPKALLRLVTCRDVGGTEVEKSSMPRQTPRMMAQRAMAYDWPLLRLVGFCLAEANSSLECRWWKCRWGCKIDRCHMSWRCLWYSMAGSS